MFRDYILLGLRLRVPQITKSSVLHTLRRSHTVGLNLRAMNLWKLVN